MTRGAPDHVLVNFDWLRVVFRRGGMPGARLWHSSVLCMKPVADHESYWRHHKRSLTVMCPELVSRHGWAELIVM